MRLGWRELVRRPGRFGVVAGALTLLVVLALVLGGLLDGLFLGSTGAIRAQDADVLVFAGDARSSFLRSRIEPPTRAAVETVEGVTEVGGLGVVLVGAEDADDEVVDVAVFGYELAPRGVPETPAPGRGWADRRLAADGVAIGDVLTVGDEVEITVDGWVEDTSYLLQGAMWVEPGTWRRALAAARPEAAFADGVFQVLAVRGDGDAAALADRIDAATGSTETLTRAEAIRSLPGTEEQDRTFSTLIGITLFVAGLVTALFFALLTIERAPLYATLKAIGAANRSLLAGLVLQAVAIAAAAFAVGGLAAFGLAQVIPAAIPVELEPDRAVATGALLVGAAAAGSALSLRRLTRIDPAEALT